MKRIADVRKPSRSKAEGLFTATGKKVLLQDGLVQALKGDASDISPKFTPALIASRLAAEKGGAVSAELTEEAVIFKAAFGA